MQRRVQRRCVLISSEMVTEKVTVNSTERSKDRCFGRRVLQVWKDQRQKSGEGAWMCEEQRGGQVTGTE